MNAIFPKINKLFVGFLMIFLIMCLIVKPQTYMQSTLNGLDVWLTKVVPALFPFFFATKLLTEMHVVEKIAKIFNPITTRLFKTPGISSYVFLMSIISGYPVGAKLISELFKQGKIDSDAATKMNSFCSTSGPLFVIGTVGVCMFYSQIIGVIILISHILGAILNGILYRSYKSKNVQTNNVNSTKNSADNILSNVMYDSIISILMVGGFIALFFVFIDVLNNTKIFFSLATILQNMFGFLKLNENFWNSILNGFVEVTRGLLDLSSCKLDAHIVCPAACFLISFGGLSVHLQSIVFLKSSKIKMSVYFLQKITHSIFSMIICSLLCLML